MCIAPESLHEQHDAAVGDAAVVADSDALSPASVGDMLQHILHVVRLRLSIVRLRENAEK